MTLNKEIEGYIASRFQKRVLDEAVNQTTPQGFGATLKFIKLSFENIKDVPSPDYSSEGAQAAAEKVEAAYGRGATQEAKDKRDNYLERVSGALAGRE